VNQEYYNAGNEFEEYQETFEEEDFAKILALNAMKINPKPDE